MTDDTLKLKRCARKGCNKRFYPNRDWQKYCPICSPIVNLERAKERQAKLTAEKQADKLRPEPMPVEKSDPKLYRIEGIYNLCNALFESAYAEKDWQFFYGKLARVIYDSTGADRTAVLKNLERKFRK